jgi:hypothetical protein
MKLRKVFAVMSALVVGGLGIAGLGFVPQAAEAGVQFN